MARPTKVGLDYFPIHVDFFQDKKLQYLRREFGIKGEHIVLQILMQIYSEGYYIAWDKDTTTTFWRTNYGQSSGVSTKLLDEVVIRLVKNGFFSADVFNQFSVLTSAGIQRRYITACARRSQITMIRDFIVLDGNELKGRTNILYLPYSKSQGEEVIADINPVIADINPVNARKNPLNINKNIRKKEEKEVNVYNNYLEIDIDEDWKQAEQAYLDNIGQLPQGTIEDDLHFFLQEVGLECFILACEQTRSSNPINKKQYLLAILRDWAGKGINTIAKAVANSQSHRQEVEKRFTRKKETETEYGIRFFGD